MIETIAVVGNGNVGHHLKKWMDEIKINCSLVNSRTLDGITGKEDLIIISVSDSVIAEIAARIEKSFPDFKGIVVHTAGSVPMNILAPFFKRFGVFYPLQTFTKEIPVVGYVNIPVFIEGNDSNTEAELVTLGERISTCVKTYPSKKRKALHLASIFACNFSNAVYDMAASILEKEDIPFSLLYPLINQTCHKAMTYPPGLCQTGPAVRGDKEIMDNHLRMLQSQEELAALYSQISDYIYKKHNTNTENASVSE